MRKIAHFVGCIIRWGGGGGAILGTLLFVVYLSVAIVSDILRVSGWPYYDWSLTLLYIVLGLLGSALIGFILGIVAAFVNSAAMALLIAALRVRRESASVPREALTFMFSLVSGLGMLSYCLIADLPGFLSVSWPAVGWGWLLGAVIPGILAACWAWKVSSKAPNIALQS